jgi:predicted nucleic acid-binding protein
VTIYPDSSFYVALRYGEDTHHIAATQYFEAHQDESLLWSPWHRVEVANTIRQLARGTRPSIPEGDARQMIHRLENDVRLGYFLHMEADWRDVLRGAYEISSAHGFSLFCRSADLLHIAYARELAAERFVTFDRDQLELAQTVGLVGELPS